MSSIQHTNYCCLIKNDFDERRWVMQIRRIIDEEIEDNGEIHVSIFNVPKALKDTNSDAYTPQLVAIGPYHCWRLEMQEMERYKLSSAKRFINQKYSNKLCTIVDRLIMIEHRIRACYHKYLDINGETLAWMMAIDATFVLEIGEIYSIEEEKGLGTPTSHMSHIGDYAKRKSSHNAMLRDIVMLENQIPLFVLHNMLDFRFQSSGMANKTLSSMLIGLYKYLSPFKMLDLRNIQPSNYAHILDFLYQSMVPKVEETVEINEQVDPKIKEEGKLCKFLSQLKEFFTKIPLNVIFKLPWIFICNLPGLTILMTLFNTKKNNEENNDNSHSAQKSRPLSVEEIMIPSIIDLSKAGVTFLPTNKDIMSIYFDKTSKTFYLPSINVDFNTEVLLRNLVAYEASSAMGPLVFTRYTELMNGIIDTKDDVRLLRESGIIHNYLKSDEEVANLWNGMSKSLRLTRVSFLDEIIENVNSYYEGNWKVMLSKRVTAYVINSWQILTFFIVILILLLLIYQAFGSLLYGSHMVSSQARERM